MIPEDNPVPEDIVALEDTPLVPVVDEGDVPPPPPPVPIVDEGDVPPPPPPPPVPDVDEGDAPPPLPPVPDVDEGDVPPPPPPPHELRIDDRVVVRNTLDLGIRIRDAPEGDRIGGMFDGETGIVVSGPREFRGLTWVEIEWDAPVKNPQSGCGIGKNVCIGWSAVFIEDGTQVIHKRE